MDQTPPPDEPEDDDVDSLESELQSFTSDEDEYYLQPLDPDDSEPGEDFKHLVPPLASTSPEGISTSLMTPHTTSTPQQEDLRQTLSRKRTRSRSDSKSPVRRQISAQNNQWNGIEDLDTAPDPKIFEPKRKPGHQLDPSHTYTPIDLFSLFVDSSAVSTLCTHTNKQAANNITKGKKYNWIPIEEMDMYKFLGLTFFFCLVKLTDIKHYWKQNTIFSQVLPPKVMSAARYRTIFWSIHISDPDDDVGNDKKKGTPQYDPLCSLRPLLDVLTMTCKKHYHPRQNLSIHRKVVATKAHTQARRANQEFKLVVLTDSSNGYTLDFSVLNHESQFTSAHGLPYETVMSLVNASYLGSGYHIYMDNFFSSPRLFKDLHDMSMGACGTYRENQDCPQTQNNALTKQDPRGSIRWIREGPLVFVKWMDSREVSICSTIHPAFKGETVTRPANPSNGCSVTTAVTCPTTIIEYNKYMKGVYFSDQLTHYHTLHHKRQRWYRTFFFNFLDIAATNAYLLHKELCRERNRTPMTHRGFLEELTAQLCGVTVSTPPSKAPEQHLPVPISHQTDKSRQASYGRRGCVYCRNTLKKEQSTPWKCYVCNVALCLIPNRNCFFKWHQNCDWALLVETNENT